MAPFINGLALGIAGGIVIMLLCLAVPLIIFILHAAWWLLSYVLPQFAAALINGFCEGARQGPSFAEHRRAMRYRQLQWLERHRLTRWYARLWNRLSSRLEKVATICSARS